MYVELADIRAEGIDAGELDDDRAEFLSAGWQSWFEHKTGNWFESRTKTFVLDGNGTRVLFMPCPIIAITALYINLDFDNAVDSDDYVIYNRYYPDDRQNPMIKLKKEVSSSSFFNRNVGVFNVGDQNQKIVGDFGYVEEDGSVPFPVFRAILSLVVMSSEYMADGDIDVLRSGLITEEVTDRHRIRFANLFKEIGQWNSTGIAEIDDALRMFKRPAFVGSPRRRRYF